ncbi:MAG: PilZ domain-containing protein [Desulfobacterales bacterium]|nr:PilZ domain-containing protein [Desulfobacterales bacterium]
MTAMSANNRKHERFGMMVPALMEVSSDPQEKLLTTRDLSSGGAYFFTSNPLAENTSGTIKIFLEPSHRMVTMDGGYVCLEVRGTVMRREEDGMAVCFNEDYRLIPFGA